MIKNQRQLEQARQRLNDLKAQIENIQTRYEGLEADIILAPLLSDVKKIENEIGEYQTLIESSLSEAVNGILKRPHLLDNIGELLAKLRIAEGLSQSELAEQLGWQQSNLSRFESEQYGSQTIAKVIEYADSLGVFLYVTPKFFS